MSKAYQNLDRLDGDLIQTCAINLRLIDWSGDDPVCD